jgi:hypothetical protein
LKALGNRLEQPGKEQMVVYAALTRAGVSSPAPVVLNVEAKRMTLTAKTGISREMIAFDGTPSSLAALAGEDRDLVETVFFDTAENFFLEQMKGAATRCLGYRFRADEQKDNVTRTSTQLIWQDNPGLATSGAPPASINGTYLAFFSSTVKPKDEKKGQGKSTDKVLYWAVRIDVKNGKIVNSAAGQVTAEDYYKATGQTPPKKKEKEKEKEKVQ